MLKKRKPTIFNFNDNYGLGYIRYDIRQNIRRIHDSRMRKTKNNLGGEHMRIKFIKHETIKTKPNAAGKVYPMTRVVGTAMEGAMQGQEWSTKFFPSMKDMNSVVKTANAGDIMDITMKQNGNFLNPVKIDIVDTNSGDNVSDPGTRSAGPMVNSPLNEAQERRDNLAVAVSIMGPKKPKTNPVDYITDVAGVADLIDDYAKKNGAFQFDPETAKEGIPEMEDDDKPFEEEEEVKEPSV